MPFVCVPLSCRSCYYSESGHCRHRTHRNSPLCARSRSRSPYSRRPRYDSYEEYQHERLKREEYRREYEKRESERAKQRERQRQKAIVSSLELTFVLQEGFFFSFPFLFAFFLGGVGVRSAFNGKGDRSSHKFFETYILK